MRLWMQKWSMRAVAMTIVTGMAGVAQAAGGAGAHERAVAAVAAWQQRHPGVEVEWKDGQPGVAMLLGLDDVVPGATEEARARTFLQSTEALIGVPAKDFQQTDISQTKMRHVVRFQQMVQMEGRALPVLNRELTVTFDAANGRVLRLVSDALPASTFVPGTLSEGQALQAAADAVHGAGATRPAHAAAQEAVVIVGQQARRVWIVHVPGRSLTDLRTLQVDAQTGVATTLPKRILD